jgi:hypothetical protein
MSGFPWRSLGLALIAGLLILVAILPDPNTANLSQLTAEELIARLGDDEVSAKVRTAVIGQLVDRSRTVLPVMQRAAPAANDQQLSGIYKVLEELMLSTDLRIADDAESTLEFLALSDQDTVRNGANYVLYSNATLRHARALAKYLEYGGRFGEQTQSGWSPMSHMAAGPGSVTPPRLLLLNPDWTGQDAGLKYVRRLFPGEELLLHVADGTPVTDAGLSELRTFSERIRLRRESESCLGIINDFNTRRPHATVDNVVSGSPAARAGLRRGDVIFALNEHPVESIESFRTITARYEPGTYVELHLYRGPTQVRLKLALGSDFGTGRCRCVDTPREAVK